MIEGLFDLGHVETLVVLEPDAVLIRAVDLTDTVPTEDLQFLTQVTPVLQGIGKVEVDADGRRANVLFTSSQWFRPCRSQLAVPYNPH